MIRWAASRPAVIWATSLVIVLGGIVSFTRLALATRTSVELPRLSIFSAWPGASAELVEMYVASPIESAIQGVRGVRKTSSNSTEGSASITAELDPKADVQIARLAILERLEILAPEFPRGVIRPRVTNFVPTELQEPTLFTLTLTGPYTAGALQKLADDILSPRIAAVPGVSGVDARGGTEYSVSIQFDGLLLRQLGISPAALGQAIAEARLVQSLGDDQRGSTEYTVTLRDQPNAVEQLADLPVRGAPAASSAWASSRPSARKRMRGDASIASTASPPSRSTSRARRGLTPSRRPPRSARRSTTCDRRCRPAPGSRWCRTRARNSPGSSTTCCCVARSRSGPSSSSSP